MVSPDYGWLHSPDGMDSACVLFKAGKACEGYFTSEDILKQASNAMDIFKKHYSNEDHVMVFDNATTHLKHADGALSARHMPKFSPRYGHQWDGTDWGESCKPNHWGVEVNMVDESGKPVHGPNGTLLKKKVSMGNGKFMDGSPQSLYYLQGHQLAGVFKGMAVIPEEPGYEGAAKIRAEWPKFQCRKEAIHCCCR
ncbi:hypothetical protein BDR07DRAFT_1483275 [Suillus spraguei]|nr:hypothetical protein BDR07DRAFT_1489771 [Suillus spraguei]KAG2363772.1 hypothetical protein BDR07DRAFT_1483275 [Suillus spraguei]